MAHTIKCAIRFDGAPHTTLTTHDTTDADIKKAFLSLVQHMIAHGDFDDAEAGTVECIHPDGHTVATFIVA